jgi:hypothetical protein
MSNPTRFCVRVAVSILAQKPKELEEGHCLPCFRNNLCPIVLASMVSFHLELTDARIVDPDKKLILADEYVVAGGTRSFFHHVQVFSHRK